MKKESNKGGVLFGDTAISWAFLENQVGLLVLDDGGRVQWVNEGSGKLFEISSDLLLGLHFKDFFYAGEADTEDVLTSVLSGQPYAGSFSLNSQEKNWLRFHCSLTPIQERKSGRIVKVLVTIGGTFAAVNTTSEASKIDQSYIYNAKLLRESIEILDQKNHALRSSQSQLHTQSDLVVSQSKKIFRQGKDLDSHLNYAHKVQQGLLGAPDEVVRKMKSGGIADAFIMYHPKEKAGGDFYWYAQKDNIQLVVAADCTGHGVPGTFLSLTGTALLKQAVYEEGILRPDQLLMYVHNSLEKLAEKNQEQSNMDRIEMSVVAIDVANNVLSFAGAGLPMCFMAKSNHLATIRGERHPIGGWYKSVARRFNLHQMPLSEVGTVFLYSDGFQDQIGGENGMKFSNRRFQELLNEIACLPANGQKNALERVKADWSGEQCLQLDDILVIGFTVG